MDDPNPVTCGHTEGGKLNLHRCQVCGLVRIGDVWCDPGALTASRERLKELEELVDKLASIGSAYKAALEHIGKCAGDCQDCRRMARSALEAEKDLESHMVVPSTCPECGRWVSVICSVDGVIHE